MFDHGPRPLVSINKWVADGFRLSVEGQELTLRGGIFVLDGVVFGWRTPPLVGGNAFRDWTPEPFRVLEHVKRPELLILGTGRTLALPSPQLRDYFLSLKLPIEVLSTRHACETFNVLSEEGRSIAAAILPLQS
jgi:NADH dehydrogenase [ubiquinone] 1 alpha subcomplex assembly factor 3